MSWAPPGKGREEHNAIAVVDQGVEAAGKLQKAIVKNDAYHPRELVLAEVIDQLAEPLMPFGQPQEKVSHRRASLHLFLPYEPGTLRFVKNAGDPGEGLHLYCSHGCRLNATGNPTPILGP